MAGVTFLATVEQKIYHLLAISHWKVYFVEDFKQNKTRFMDIVNIVNIVPNSDFLFSTNIQHVKGGMYFMFSLNSLTSFFSWFKFFKS